MANKYYGRVGFTETLETSPGVHTEIPTEHYYYGDVLRNVRRLEPGQHLNDNLNVSVEISIVADPYARNHFHSMRYVEYAGALWEVTSVDATQYPRLILSVGGVYNGEQA